MSYVAFTLRTAMLYVDARIGIESILQVPKTWVINHYTIEQTCFVNANIQLFFDFARVYCKFAKIKPFFVQGILPLTMSLIVFVPIWKYLAASL